VDLGTAVLIAGVVGPMCAVVVHRMKLRFAREKLGFLRHAYNKGGPDDVVAVAKAMTSLNADEAGGTRRWPSEPAAQEHREVGGRRDDEQQCA
jgi:hypothetical protein